MFQGLQTFKIQKKRGFTTILLNFNTISPTTIDGIPECVKTMQIWLGLGDRDTEGQPGIEHKGLIKHSGPILQLCLDKCKSVP